MKQERNGNSRSLQKRLLAALLVTTLSVACIPPVTAESAYAAESVCMTEPVYAAAQDEGWTTITTPVKNGTTISVRDGALYIDALPSGGDYKYVFFSYGGPEAKGETFPISAPQPLPLPKKDGTYDIRVQFHKELKTPGVAIVRALKLTVKDGRAFFPKSPVYDHNLKLQKKAEKLKAPNWYYTMQTFLSYFQTLKEQKEFEKKLKKQAEEIVDAGDSDYVKIRKVHDWVATNIWYDYDDYRGIESSYVGEVSVLEHRRTVCEGYACLTAALLRSLGIPAKVISGTVTYTGWNADGTPKDNLAGHAWNEAYADGRWIIMDTTWDSNNRYKNGKFSEKTDPDRDYFDPPLEIFSLDHMTEEDRQKERRESEIYYHGLRISTYSMTLMKGKTKKLTVKTEPDMKFINLKKDAKITFSSSNKKVATVSKKGVVKAKKSGQAVITTTVKIADAVIEIETDVWVR